MRIDFTKKPINPADRKASYIIVDKIIVADCTIRGDLYDDDDNLIAKRRVYAYEGGYKNMPFDDLHTGVISYLDGDEPADTWLVGTIRLWLDDRQVEGEDGIVSNDDHYYSTEKALK